MNTFKNFVIGVKLIDEKTNNKEVEIVGLEYPNGMLDQKSRVAVMTEVNESTVYRISVNELKNAQITFTPSIDVENDAVFLPGVIHGAEWQLYLIYLNPDSDEPSWEINKIDSDGILDCLKEWGKDEFFGYLGEYYHGRWGWDHYNPSNPDDYSHYFDKATFVVGRDGTIDQEIDFLREWAEAVNEGKYYFAEDDVHEKSEESSDTKTNNVIYTHDKAMQIVEMLEDILTEHNIRVPSPDDDDRDVDDMGLYGTTYSNLLEDVEEFLVEMLASHNPETVIITGQ